MATWFILAPICSKDPHHLDLHMACGAILLIRWLFNLYDCELTKLEAYLSGKKKEDGIVYQMVNPVFHITKSELKYWLVVITVMLLQINRYRQFRL